MKFERIVFLSFISLSVIFVEAHADPETREQLEVRKVQAENAAWRDIGFQNIEDFQAQWFEHILKFQISTFLSDEFSPKISNYLKDYSQSTFDANTAQKKLNDLLSSLKARPEIIDDTEVQKELRRAFDVYRLNLDSLKTKTNSLEKIEINLSKKTLESRWHFLGYFYDEKHTFVKSAQIAEQKVIDQLNQKLPGWQEEKPLNAVNALKFSEESVTSFRKFIAIVLSDKFKSIVQKKRSGEFSGNEMGYPFEFIFEIADSVNTREKITDSNQSKSQSISDPSAFNVFDSTQRTNLILEIDQALLLEGKFSTDLKNVLVEGLTDYSSYVEELSKGFSSSNNHIFFYNPNSLGLDKDALNQLSQRLQSRDLINLLMNDDRVFVSVSQRELSDKIQKFKYFYENNFLNSGSFWRKNFECRIDQGGHSVIQISIETIAKEETRKAYIEFAGSIKNSIRFKDYKKARQQLSLFLDRIDKFATDGNTSDLEFQKIFKDSWMLVKSVEKMLEARSSQ